MKYARENIESFNDKKTLEEMLTFVRNEKGRAEAEEGCHDDLVMSMAIALYARSQQRQAMPQIQDKAIYNFDFERPKANPLGIGDEITIILR